MKVLLIGNYQNDKQESMQRFANMMLQGLANAGVDVELIYPKAVFGLLFRSDIGLGKWLGYLDKFLVFPLVLKRRLLTLSSQHSLALLVHICDHSNAFYTRYMKAVAHLVTCHDLLAVRSALGEIPQNRPAWTGRRLQNIILKGLEKAHHIACASRATGGDVLRLATLKPRDVSIIPLALNYTYSPMPKEEANVGIQPLLAHSSPNQRKISCPTRYILHVGGNQWYKNRMGVLRIYSKFITIAPDAHSLFMVGKPFTPEMKSFISSQGFEDRVVSLESCSNEQLRALYSAAELLLFPSLAEGFGWPVIEAQACGCPVVCSNVASLPEVAGDAAIMCDPEDENGFANALSQIYTSESLRDDLIDKGFRNARRFSVEEMIANYLRLYLALQGSSR